MDKPTCRTCPYWDLQDPETQMGATGSCQRHAPRWGVGENGDEPVFFPLTLDWQFCGEHPDFPGRIASKRAESSA